MALSTPSLAAIEASPSIRSSMFSHRSAVIFRLFRRTLGANASRSCAMPTICWMSLSDGQRRGWFPMQPVAPPGTGCGAWVHARRDIDRSATGASRRGRCAARHDPRGRTHCLTGGGDANARGRVYRALCSGPLDTGNHRWNLKDAVSKRSRAGSRATQSRLRDTTESWLPIGWPVSGSSI